jgi:hypothetical protein
VPCHQESYRSILQVEYIIDIITTCGGKKTTVSGMPEAIFLENVVVRDATFDTLVEVTYGRGWSWNAFRVKEHCTQSGC